MDREPRLLVWNYGPEEKARMDALLKEIEAPPAVAIESTQGNLVLREIIHHSAHGQDRFASDEKVILFYNIPQKGIFFLMNVLKQAGLPQPIYAVVTEHSIDWRFCDLLKHLVAERASAQARMPEVE